MDLLIFQQQNNINQLDGGVGDSTDDDDEEEEDDNDDDDEDLDEKEEEENDEAAAREEVNSNSCIYIFIAPYQITNSFLISQFS